LIDWTGDCQDIEAVALSRHGVELEISLICRWKLNGGGNESGRPEYQTTFLASPRSAAPGNKKLAVF